MRAIAVEQVISVGAVSVQMCIRDSYVTAGAASSVLVGDTQVPPTMLRGYAAVSYTHLDVYKRQVYGAWGFRAKSNKKLPANPSSAITTTNVTMPAILSFRWGCRCV